MEIIHTSVLLNETLEWLSPENESFADNAFMVDSTLGEGGHSFAFLNRYKNLRIIGLDADQNIQARARERLSCFGNRMNFHLGWFNDFYANYPDNLPKPNLILFDLGISVILPSVVTKTPNVECSLITFSVPIAPACSKGIGSVDQGVFTSLGSSFSLSPIAPSIK